MTFEAIERTRSGNVVTITLNRPERLNAITSQMISEIMGVLDDITHDQTIRALVLTGAGRGFCAGQDLNDRKAEGGQRPDLGETVENQYNPLLRALHGLRVPTIAAVNGTAAGAGANIALSCDLVLAAERAKFIQVYANIGLVPDAGGSFMLPRLIGLARARELAMTARPVKASEAVEMGMIMRAVSDDQLMDEAMALAEDLAVKPTMGLVHTRRVLDASFSNDLDSQLALERDSMQICGFSDDYAEGVSAFLEKRKPVFTGK